MSEALPHPVPPPGARFIPLTQGKFALVDEGDYERLARWKWYAYRSRGRWYARRRGQCLHRAVFGEYPSRAQIRFLNGDPLNCRRANLDVVARGAARATPPGCLIEGARYIPLAGGGLAIVDVEDYARLAGYLWRPGRDDRPKRRVVDGGGKQIFIYHDVIGMPPPGHVVDHINGNVLDNRRSNLRFADRSESSANRKPQPNKTGFRGVSFDARCGRYRGMVKWRGKQYWTSVFLDAKSASEAREALARRLHGEFYRPL